MTDKDAPDVNARDAPGAIDRRHYETSGYFEMGGPHLLDPESAFQRYRVREVLKLCHVRSGSRAVDLGCGWGTISFGLARTAAVVVGVDFAAAALTVCRSRLAAEPIDHLHFVQADVAETGLRGGVWDLVVAADLVEHLYAETTRRAYGEAHRLLRAGGRLVVWTPNPGHFLERLRVLGVLEADPTHVDYKTLERVTGELEATGFAIEMAHHVQSHVPFLRTVERWGHALVPGLRRRVAVVAVRKR